MEGQKHTSFVKMLSANGRFAFTEAREDDTPESLAAAHGYDHAYPVGESEYFAYFAVAAHGFSECMERHESFSAARMSGLLTENRLLRQRLQALQPEAGEQGDARTE